LNVVRWRDFRLRVRKFCGLTTNRSLRAGSLILLLVQIFSLGASVLRFFGSSVLRFFGSSVLRFFGSSSIRRVVRNLRVRVISVHVLIELPCLTLRLLMATAVSDRDPDLGTGRPPEEGIGRPCGNPELKVVRELERRRRRESS